MFSENYPNIKRFVKEHGWIEIGYDDFSESFVRALDIGGMIWEGQPSYQSLDEALKELETALEAWNKENLDL